ncbi:uncharacterized protein LOC126745295 [Anthonomus grandis grandis]|uniref:uncharacterized protein LOC126745295 n=1 Tax=Anthonomus grandis grandis TaxID=2921223 RepID=UPI002166B989|nr:uncharacterized protein LOC126745295 [Anthonomus grandis grandis]
MDPKPSCSKSVSVADANYEDQLLKWYNETDSECSDLEQDCDEDFVLESDHETDSEEDGSESEEKTMETQDMEITETEDSEDEEITKTVRQKVSKSFYGKNRFKWAKEPLVSRSRTQKHNIIIQLPGIRPKAITGTSCCMEMLFTDHILEIIIQWTNNKIEKLRLKYKNQNSPTLKNIDKIELSAFLGLLAFTAIFKSNHENIDTIFKTNGTGREIIRCIMSKERFAFLLLALRFDNTDDRAFRKVTDPAAPISQIFQLFVENCQASYSIGSSGCIDEMLVGFRGRCKFKMYIPNKPTKYGLKIMCLTDARNNFFLMVIFTKVKIRMVKDYHKKNKNKKNQHSQYYDLLSRCSTLIEM